ncbi:MAG: ornithine carbamoyltransferase [Acidimicrobiales bacterium]
MTAAHTDTVPSAGGVRHVLDVDDLSCDELDQVLDLASMPPESLGHPLAGKGVALVFEKPSARTRSSSELAVVALGGHPVYIQASEVGIDQRETAEDVARTLSCYHDMLCARVLDHSTLVRMSGALDDLGPGGGPEDGIGARRVPVVNLLSDAAHPCQALADLLTMKQVFGALGGRTLAYVGDANNVWRSLSRAAAMAGMRIRVASPEGYGPDDDEIEHLLGLGADVEAGDDPRQASAGADVLYTDVWTSMGQEAEAEIRRTDFAGFAVDATLVAQASPDAVVMHCLPAHRGEEIAADVFEGPRSVVWRQAANRLHAMRGLLAWTFGAVPPPWPGSAGAR